MTTNWLYAVITVCCICSSCALLFDRDSHYPLIRAAEREADTHIEKQGYRCIGAGGSGTSDLRIISKEFACRNVKFLSIDEARMFLNSHITMYISTSKLTVCVTCGWAGVDKTSRAGLPRSGVFGRRKSLKMPQNPTRQVHALLGGFDHKDAMLYLWTLLIVLEFFEPIVVLHKHNR